jgi:hypothetical protein
MPRMILNSDGIVVEHYISVVAHRVQVLAKRIEDAGQPKYASSSAATLSKILARILARFFDELRSLHQEIDSQPPDDIVRQVRTIHYVTVAIIPELIEAVKMANLDSPLASITEAYEHIGNLVQYGTQTIIHPTWEYNASFDEIMSTLRAMTRNLGRDTGEAIFSGAPPSFVIITYPIAEEDMVLRQAFIAHELGHFINRTEGWSKALLEERVFAEEDQNIIREVVQSLQNESDKEKVFAEALMLVGAITPLWVEEIIADFLAVCVLGPAYLLAFDEVSLSPRYSSPGRLYRSHPPGQLRKGIMGELVDELYLAPIRSREVSNGLSRQERDVFKSVCEWIDAIVRADPLEFKSIDNAPAPPPEIIAAIYGTLRKTMRRVVSRLKESQLERIKRRKWFCIGRDIVDALELQDLLSHGLTPTELYSDPNRDPSFSAVMNSGWFHFLHNKKDYLYFHRSKGASVEFVPSEVRDRYVNLQNLVAKAVESLHFKREFLRRRGMSSEEEDQS